MRLYKRYLILIVAVFILSVALFYFPFKNTHKTPATETISVIEYSRSLTCLPQYIAMKKGYFQTQNLKVELKTASSFQDLDEALKKQNQSIILCESETIINHQFQNSYNPVVFAGITDKEDSFLLGRMDSSGFTQDNIKGNSIITGEPDSLQSMVLENILRGEKIRPNYEVNLMQNLPDNLKRGIFKSGTASFIVLKEPETTLLENANEGKTLLSLGTTGGEMPALVLTCNKQFLNSHPQTVQKYTNAIFKATLWMNCHSTKETVGIMKEFFPNTEPKTLISAIDRYKGLSIWPKTPVITQASYDNLLKIMQQSGELSMPKKFTDIVDNQFATAAAQNITYTPEEEEQKNKKFSFSKNILKILTH